MKARRWIGGGAVLAESLGLVVLALATVLSLGTVAIWMRHRKLVSLHPHVMCAAPLFLVILLRPPGLKTLLLVQRRRAWVFAPLWCLAGWSLLCSALPQANFDLGGRLIVAISADAIFLSLACAACYSLTRDEMANLAKVALVILGLSLLSDLQNPARLGNESGRPAGFGVNSNSSALAACIATLCTLRKSRLTAWSGLWFCLGLFVLVLPLSRSGWALGAVAALGAIVMGLAQGARRFLATLGLGLVLVVAVVGSVEFLDLRGFESRNAQRRLEMLAGQRYAGDSGREQLAIHGFEDFLESPLVGHGTGFHRSTFSAGVHNEYLRNALDLGLIGLALYLAFVLGLGLEFLQTRDFPGLILTVVVAAAGMVSHNLLDSPYVLMGLGLSLGAGLAPAPTGKGPSSTAARATSKRP